MTKSSRFQMLKILPVIFSGNNYQVNATSTVAAIGSGDGIVSTDSSSDVNQSKDMVLSSVLR